MPYDVPPGRDLRLGGRTFAPGETGLLAIINRTPDSFYDEGRYLDDEVALSAVARAVADGADGVAVGAIGDGASHGRERDLVVEIPPLVVEGVGGAVDDGQQPSLARGERAAAQTEVA